MTAPDWSGSLFNVKKKIDSNFPSASPFIDEGGLDRSVHLLRSPLLLFFFIMNGRSKRRPGRDPTCVRMHVVCVFVGLITCQPEEARKVKMWWTSGDIGQRPRGSQGKPLESQLKWVTPVLGESANTTGLRTTPPNCIAPHCYILNFSPHFPSLTLRTKRSIRRSYHIS